jgi:hypothetical protein
MCGRYVEWGIPHLKATAVLGLLGGVEVLEGLAQKHAKPSKPSTKLTSH